MSNLLALNKADKRRTRAIAPKPSVEPSTQGAPGSIFSPSAGRMPRAKQSGAAALRSAKSSRAAQHLQLVELFRADPMDRVTLVKAGVPATDFVVLAAHMNMAKERLASTLGLARATVDRKIRDNKMLSPDESSRVLGLASLVGQVQSLVAESGQPQDFDAGAWVSHWLEQPVPALGGRRPAELMDTPEGQGIVSRLVAQMQSGAYA
jgi:putative toxin-antitoxin system antitoxin component (TIGR02293 family)